MLFLSRMKSYRPMEANGNAPRQGGPQLPISHHQTHRHAAILLRGVQLMLSRFVMAGRASAPAQSCQKFRRSNRVGVTEENRKEHKETQKNTFFSPPLFLWLPISGCQVEVRRVG